MRKYWPAVIAVSLTMASAVAAQEAQQAQQAQQAGAMAAAADVSVGTAIENRELVGPAESFALSAGKVFCMSRVSNAAGSQVEHVWYKGETEVARVSLAINGSPWRTYSSKNLGDDGAGDWRCDVVHDGRVLQSARFRVE